METFTSFQMKFACFFFMYFSKQIQIVWNFHSNICSFMEKGTRKSNSFVTELVTMFQESLNMFHGMIISRVNSISVNLQISECYYAISK